MEDQDACSGDSLAAVKSTRPLIVGEVLFDQFSNGTRVLGGAPFNVAWNLQGLGLAPLMLTAVGDDKQGQEVRDRMSSWGMDLAALQTAESSPTGQVQVAIEDGEPSYEILDRQAYDEIQYPATSISAEEFALLYVGSLAFRRETTRSTMRRLMAEAGLPRFVDINIRDPWFEADWAPELLQDAQWTKLNQHELASIAGADCENADQVAAAVDLVRAKYGGRCYLITCGSSGAYACDADGGCMFVAAPSPEPMIDAVGAGDAFAAAAIFGVIGNWPLEKTLRAAVRFASRACTIQGATTTDQEHYQALEAY
ncbi:MAG: PfkB family carbohydrate kinase [Planctomycetota bacterium]